MKGKALIACAVLLALLLSGCGTGSKKTPEQLEGSREKELLSMTQEFVRLLDGGEYDAAIAMMDETMTKSMEGQLESTWLSLTSAQGAFKETGGYIGESSDGFDTIELTLYFEGGSLIQRTVFDGENRIAGLWYRAGEVGENTVSQAVSDNIDEVSVTVDAGDGYPLSGIITMPKDGSPVAAVVLVHGSGPNDMDENVGQNAPFRDLALELAGKGIAVLRYDKRTYTYGSKMAALPDSDKLTVDEETVYDAVAAVKLLKSWEGIDESRVYLLGHSMGGGLLSYINSMGADCAGYIIMAGTPRNLWELSAEQSLLYAEELDAAGEAKKAAELRSAVELEVQKGLKLSSLSDEEALKEGNSVFGTSAWYLRKFDQIDAVSLHLADGKPVLVLQGEADRQVTMTDFQLWKDGLSTHSSALFRSYPRLNHLFGEFKGESVPFSEMVPVEYAQRTPVSDAVISDISDWLHGISQ